MYDYSPEFKQLISDPARLQDLLENCSFGGSFASWEKRKAFIGQAINKDGTILDLGSGNGFLLRCLQEWLRYELMPYGVDINPKFIQKAKELFPQFAANFAVLNANGTEELVANDLPNQYDFVYFSDGWKGWTLSIRLRLINKLLDHVAPGGKLIIGFYNEDEAINSKALADLKASKIAISGEAYNPNGTNLICWIDKEHE